MVIKKQMYLAFDIGGTNIKYALVSNEGELQAHTQMLTPSTYQELVHFICEVVTRFVKVKGIALSCPGIFNPVTNTITGSSALSYIIDQRLKEDIEKRTGKKVSIENDGNCALLGEYWMGHAQGKKSAVIFVVGSAVGGGVLLNGKIIRGANLQAGELGYMLVDIEPKVQRFKSLGGKVGMHGLLHSYESQMHFENGKDLFEQMKKNDNIKKNMEFKLRYLAAAIINMQYILDPEVVVLGGGISENPIFLEMVKEAIMEILKCRPHYCCTHKIVNAKNGNQANLLGAVYKLLYAVV